MIFILTDGNVSETYNVAVNLIMLLSLASDKQDEPIHSAGDIDALVLIVLIIQ
jgi:hypothetical protein